MKRYVLAVIVPLLIVGASIATAQDTTTREAAFDFADERELLRHQGHNAKVNRCRPHLRFHFARSAAEIPQSRWRPVIAKWTRARDYARSRPSRCFLARVWREYLAIPEWRKNAWQAIHSCEGSWNDPNDPYWGGLQFDRSFMATYGRDALRYYGGLANVWAPFVQVVVADRAYRSGRGFYPWPYCARQAGLI